MQGSRRQEEGDRKKETGRRRQEEGDRKKEFGSRNKRDNLNPES